MGNLVAPEEVRFPYMRWQVMTALASMADPAYQQRVWVRKQMPRRDYYDDLQHVIHVLLDDSDVLENPSGTLGEILVSDEEVAAMKALYEAFAPMVDDLRSSPDEVYLADGRWPRVVRAATEALSAVVRGGPFELRSLEGGA